MNNETQVEQVGNVKHDARVQVRGGGGYNRKPNSAAEVQFGSRHDRAIVINAERLGRSIDQQIAELDTRLGVGMGAVRERARLQSMKDGTYVKRGSAKKKQDTVSVDASVEKHAHVSILTTGPQAVEYAHEIENALKQEGVSVNVDDSKRKLGEKIHDAADSRYIVHVGIKEVQARTMFLRKHGSDEELAATFNGFAKRVANEIKVWGDTAK